MTTFFTADHHFGHANIIEYSNRPFRSVQEMDMILIQKWNEVVDDKDLVYYVGDFTLQDYSFARDIFAQLRGTIYFIPGSHDGRWLKPYQTDGYPFYTKSQGPVKLLPPLHTLKYAGLNPEIVLCHYAMRSWDRSHYGTWHLFGHHHGHLAPYGLSFDIGVDCWDYYPVSLGQVSEKMKTLSPIVDYSKKGNRNK